MELFEYILIIASVVYALALAQILTGFGHMAQTEVRIRLYFPHAVWIAIVFVMILLTWWAGWEFRGIEWTFPKYIFLFVSPILAFFATILLIPQNIGESGVDLEKHFNRVRRPMAWSFFGVLVAQFVDGSLLTTEPWWFPGRIPQLAVLGATIGVALTENRRLQGVFSVGILVFLLFMSVVRFWFPE